VILRSEDWFKPTLRFYPYLSDYVLRENLRSKRVLEIDLGFGTLGNLLVSQGTDYYGIDIANGPLITMRCRIGVSWAESSVQDAQRVGTRVAIQK
jgi:hypothetical protein